jgi:hypothetical protein
MAGAQRTSHEEETDRRNFLKRIAVAGAAAAALGILIRRPFGKARRDGKSVPADLPGAGSIFQPRGDRRRQR